MSGNFPIAHTRFSSRLASPLRLSTLVTKLVTVWQPAFRYAERSSMSMMWAANDVSMRRSARSCSIATLSRSVSEQSVDAVSLISSSSACRRSYWSRRSGCDADGSPKAMIKPPVIMALLETMFECTCVLAGAQPPSGKVFFAPLARPPTPVC